jgi:hypothetical protein
LAIDFDFIDFDFAIFLLDAELFIGGTTAGFIVAWGAGAACAGRPTGTVTANIAIPSAMSADTQPFF